MEANQNTVDKIAAIVEKNRKAILTSFVLFLVLGLVIFVYDWNQGRVEKSASIALFKADQIYSDEIKKISDEVAPEPKEDSKEKVDRTVLMEKREQAIRMADLSRFAKVIASYEEVIKNYPSSTSAAQAALSLSRMYAEREKYDQALEVLSKQKVSSNGLLSALVLFQMGNLYLAKSNYQSALDQYQKILAQESFKYLHGDALLKSGVAFEGLGQLPKAKESYEKAIRDFGTTSAARTAKKYIRLIEYSQSQTKGS